MRNLTQKESFHDFFFQMQFRISDIPPSLCNFDKPMFCAIQLASQSSIEKRNVLIGFTSPFPFTISVH